jgi:dynein heavy chain
MNPNYANRTELTENLKSYFRCVSVNLPEYEKIIEVMLYSKGFREAAELSSKICKLYQLLNVQFNEQKHYDFGLRGMKNLMFLIEKHRNPKITEEATVRIALFENLKSRLT